MGRPIQKWAVLMNEPKFLSFIAYKLLLQVYFSVDSNLYLFR